MHMIWIDVKEGNLKVKKNHKNNLVTDEYVKDDFCMYKNFINEFFTFHFILNHRVYHIQIQRGTKKNTTIQIFTQDAFS